MHATLDAGYYDIVGADGKARRLEIVARREPARPEKAVPKAKRYELEGIVFAQVPRSPTAAAFDGAVTNLFAALPARGPAVSKDQGRNVRSAESRIGDLEQDVRNGRMQRSVTRRGGALVASYLYRRGAWREGFEVSIAGKTVEIHYVDKRDGDRKLTHRVAWTPKTKTLDTLHDFGSGTVRMVETSQGGTTTGWSKYDSHDFATTHTVDKYGKSTDKDYVKGDELAALLK
jgi:hypothetical protein